jgi:hypothetical protein
MFESQAGEYPHEAYLLTRLLALPTNIRLRCKCLAVTNTQAYSAEESITIVKSFMLQEGKAILVPVWNKSRLDRFTPKNKTILPSFFPGYSLSTKELAYIKLHFTILITNVS